MGMNVNRLTLPIALYGDETRSMTEADKMLNAMEMKCVRSMSGLSEK